VGRKVHKLDREHIKHEAEKAKGGDLAFYEWVMGDNELRLGPPYNEKGRLFLPVITHFEIPPDKQVHKCLETWGLDSCPICAVIEELYAEITEIDLGRQTGSLSYYSNVIDRGDDAIWKTCRFTSKVYNWIMSQIDHPKIGDIFDPDTGFDLNIRKAKKKGKKGGSYVDYTPGLLPDRTPLDDDSDYIDTLLENLPDLDSVFSEPDANIIREMEGAAKRMKTYYLRRNNVDDSRSTNETQRRYSSPSSKSDEPGQKKEKRRYGQANQKEAKNEEEKKDTRPTDSDTPVCLASLKNPEKNSSGSFGYFEECEDCLLCPDDMECLDAIQSRPELNR
jgi:hypothetical protein